MNEDHSSLSSGGHVVARVEDVGDRTNSPTTWSEPWRDEIQSWGHIFRYLYDGDTASAAPSSNFILNKDVSFRVGKEVIWAHSFILQLKSGYFSRVLAKAFAEALMGKGRYRDEEGHELWELEPLIIPNSLVDPDTFKAVIKFMYVEEMDEVSDEKLVQLVDASQLFEIRLMEKKCKLMLESRVNRMNVVAIYSVAERFKNEKLMGKCADIILKLGAEFFVSPDFLNISHGLLRRLLASNDLKIPELVVYRSSLMWAREQLKQSNLVENGENLRKILNEAIRLIRFPLLTSNFIVKEVRPLGILTDKEFSGLACWFLSQRTDDKEQFFCSEPRLCQEKANKVPPSVVDQQQSGTGNQFHHRIEPELSVSPQTTSGESNRQQTQPTLPSNTKTPLSQLFSNSIEKPQTQHIIPINLRNPFTENITITDVTQILETPTTSKTAVEILPTRQPNPIVTANTVDIFSSSSSEQEDGEVARTPRPIPRALRVSSSDSITSQNGDEVNQRYQGDRKRKLSTGSYSDSKRSHTSPPEGCDKVVTITGTLEKVLTYYEILKLIKVALLDQKVDGLHQIAKIILVNVLLPKRRVVKPIIVVPNIRHIEIVFDCPMGTKHGNHPDDYLIFGSGPDDEVLLDKGLWQGNTRFSLWENGIRRFEVNPEDRTLFLWSNDDQATSCHIVKRLVADLETDHLIKKLALSATSVHSKLNPAKLTHLVLHRCSLERTDFLRDCMNLEKLSWVGIFESDTFNLSHLSNSATTLTTLSLCNINVTVEKDVVSLIKVQTLHLVMCKWDSHFEEQLGFVCPSILRFFITAYHNWIPSCTMAFAFLTQMKGIENVLISFAPPYVLNCAGRVEAGKRFLKFMESKVIVTNENLSAINIPRNGFRLRKMGRNWNFLNLPLSTSSPQCPVLVDKEYFDYFLLQVFARDAVAYFRETTLECKHKFCRGRYFHQGNILNLCLHEQNLMYNGTPSCCTGSAPFETPKLEK